MQTRRGGEAAIQSQSQHSRARPGGTVLRDETVSDSLSSYNQDSDVDHDLKI